MCITVHHTRLTSFSHTSTQFLAYMHSLSLPLPLPTPASSLFPPLLVSVERLANF